MNKKISVILGAIIILIAIGEVVWVATNQQDQPAPAELPKQEVIQQEQPVANEQEEQPSNQEAVSEETQPTIDTSDWQTYRDESGLFKIKYPPNWVYSIENDRVHFREKGKKYLIEMSDIYAIGIGIGDSKYPDRLNYDEYIAKAKERNNELKFYFFDNKKTIQKKNYLGIETSIYYNEPLNYYLSISTPNFGSDEINKPIWDVYFAMLETLEFLK